jgi:cation transporter-like permease
LAEYLQRVITAALLPLLVLTNSKTGSMIASRMRSRVGKGDLDDAALSRPRSVSKPDVPVTAGLAVA